MDQAEGSEKKPWLKPELIVLVRSNPQEMVLMNCKMTLNSPTGSQRRCRTGGSACVNSATVTS
jgi:hypothetical protein